MDSLYNFPQTVLNVVLSLKPFYPMLIIGMIAERFLAVYPVSFSRIAVNFAYAIFAFSLSATIVAPIVGYLNAHLPLSLLKFHPQNFSTLGQIAFWLSYLVFFDFLYYWFHRAQHTFSWMWRYHMVHHSDENISCSAFVRHHWLEELWRYGFMTAPLILMFGDIGGMPFWAVMLLVIFAVGMHLNTSTRFGVLESLIITPHYHRIHHSIEEKHYNQNFGAFLQLWDFLFKTRYLPVKGEFPRTGIVDFNEKYFPALLLPIPLIPKKSGIRTLDPATPSLAGEKSPH
jgi:sterol desaturase/sphingolipid hydroxylase (fatty acid hydroxylase superfamily)